MPRPKGERHKGGNVGRGWALRDPSRTAHPERSGHGNLARDCDIALSDASRTHETHETRLLSTLFPKV